jgi:hypothetical protein
MLSGGLVEYRFQPQRAVTHYRLEVLLTIYNVFDRKLADRHGLYEHPDKILFLTEIESFYTHFSQTYSTEYQSQRKVMPSDNYRS